MLLTITSRTSPARDLGFLLHKHPDRVQDFSVSAGRVHVAYPVATDGECTAALVLDIEPLDLSKRRGRGRSLYEYVNDRPYVASSFLSVALRQVYGTALAGRCDSRPELVDMPLDLEVTIASVACDEGEGLIRGLFEPLGYGVAVETGLLDGSFPDWGPSGQFTVTLTGSVVLHRLLTHLYVLLPVLDDAKHYWVDEDEVDKLLRYGEDWLAEHPLRDEISHRYLKRRRHLSRQVIEELADEDLDGGGDDAPGRPLLREQRMDAVLEHLLASGATTVADLGCGEGALLQRLLPEQQFRRIVGVDLSLRSLRRAKDRLRLERLPTHHQDRVELLQGSLVYADDRLQGVDAAALVEVVEHVDPWRLPALERSVFGVAAPTTVVVTTPNAEFNVRYEGLAPSEFRHADHRFEWTRDEFRTWADRVAGEHGYTVTIHPVGDVDPEVGPPTQMAVFRAGLPVDASGGAA